MTVKPRQILSVVSWLVTGPLVILALLMVVTSNFMGWQFSTVLSGSMEPTFHVGSLAVVVPADPQDLRVGDIITFNRDGRRITHRIVAVHGTSGGRSFVTKGDANNAQDDAEVVESSVVGRASTSIPYIGQLALKLRTPVGAGLLGGLVAAAIFFSIAGGKAGSAGQPAPSAKAS